MPFATVVRVVSIDEAAASAPTPTLSGVGTAVTRVSAASVELLPSPLPSRPGRGCRLGEALSVPSVPVPVPAPVVPLDRPGRVGGCRRRIWSLDVQSCGDGATYELVNCDEPNTEKSEDRTGTRWAGVTAGAMGAISRLR